MQRKRRSIRRHKEREEKESDIERKRDRERERERQRERWTKDNRDAKRPVRKRDGGGQREGQKIRTLPPVASLLRSIADERALVASAGSESGRKRS